MQNEKSTSRTPLVFTVIVILLVVLRVSVWYIETFGAEKADGIKWQEPSRVDLAGVRDYQQKLIFYYFCEENSESCRRIDHGALLNKNVVKSVNDNFLPIKVLCKPGAELSKAIEQRFGILMCPAFVITLPSGNEVGVQKSYFGVSVKNLLCFINYCKQREKYVSGLDRLAHAQYEQAARALQKWLQTKNKSDPQVLDGALYCALAHMMLFEENAAQKVLATIGDGQYAQDSNWPQPLVQFLLGKLGEQNLLQRCVDQESRLAQCCYFIGMLQKRNGDFRGAVDNFRRAQRINEVSPEIRNLIDGQLSIMSPHSN